MTGRRPDKRATGVRLPVPRWLVFTIALSFGVLASPSADDVQNTLNLLRALIIVAAARRRRTANLMLERPLPPTRPVGDSAERRPRPHDSVRDEP